MKAVRIHEYGGPDVLRYEEGVPRPSVKADTVLVELVATSVNPIDWKMRSGARKDDFPLQLPAILGRDVSGVVREIGSSVTMFRPGDWVIGAAEATYAQYAAVPESILSKLPDGLDPVRAAALPLVATTGDQLVRLAAQANTGDTILVTGALGSVGRAAVHSAKQLGANVIAGVRGRQLTEAQSLGAWQVVALDDENALASLDRLDAVADTIGGSIAEKLLPQIKDGGRFGYASVLPEEVAGRYPQIFARKVFARPNPDRLVRYAEDLRDGRFDLPISTRMPLRDVATAHATLEQGGWGKVVLEI